MDTITAIKERKSIRAFTDKAVSRELITEIINSARWSPSYKNSQPWKIVVVAGEKKEKLSEKLLGLFAEGVKPEPDFPPPDSWPEREQSQIDRLLAMRKEATGLDFSDPQVVAMAKKANFNFYGAPCALYLFQDKSLGPWSIFDIGMFAQSLMLTAHVKGLGTVPQAFATDYAPQIKEFLDIPQSKRIVLAISMGWPDMDSPVNQLKTDRMDIADIVHWLE